nr:hypothetical protein [uncultured Sphaerochaeta sp.]
MSLQICAYSKVRKAEDQGVGGNEPLPTYGECFTVDENPDFPGRCDEFQRGTIVRIEGESYDEFNVGYGFYNRIRDQIAKLSGYPLTRHKMYGRVEESYAAGAWKADGGPFWELINFSDCEGVIGTSVSKKLADDFKEYQEKADKLGKDFSEYYSMLRKCFELASDNGLVVFC